MPDAVPSRASSGRGIMIRAPPAGDWGAAYWPSRSGGHWAATWLAHAIRAHAQGHRAEHIADHFAMRVAEDDEHPSLGYRYRHTLAETHRDLTSRTIPRGNHRSASRKARRATTPHTSTRSLLCQKQTSAQHRHRHTSLRNQAAASTRHPDLSSPRGIHALPEGSHQ